MNVLVAVLIIQIINMFLSFYFSSKYNFLIRYSEQHIMEIRANNIIEKMYNIASKLCILILLFYLLGCIFYSKKILTNFEIIFSLVFLFGVSVIIVYRIRYEIYFNVGKLLIIIDKQKHEIIINSCAKQLSDVSFKFKKHYNRHGSTFYTIYMDDIHGSKSPLGIIREKDKIDLLQNSINKFLNENYVSFEEEDNTFLDSFLV